VRRCAYQLLHGAYPQQWENNKTGTNSLLVAPTTSYCLRI